MPGLPQAGRRKNPYDYGKPANNRSLELHLCGGCHKKYRSMPTRQAMDELSNCDRVRSAPRAPTARVVFDIPDMGIWRQAESPAQHVIEGGCGQVDAGKVGS